MITSRLFLSPWFLWLIQTVLIWTTWGLISWKYGWLMSCFYGFGLFVAFGLLCGFSFNSVKRKRLFMGVSGMMASMNASFLSIFFVWLAMEPGQRQARAGAIMFLVVSVAAWLVFSAYGMREFPTRVAAPTNALNN